MIGVKKGVRIMNKYERLFVEAPIGIFRTNEAGEVLSVNQSLAEY